MYFASVAQSVVHLTRNEKVACSSHVTSSIKGHSIWSGFLWYICNFTDERGCFVSLRGTLYGLQIHLSAGGIHFAYFITGLNC